MLVLFFSNLVITEVSAATRNSIPLQSSFLDCSINLLVILWGLLSVRFNALVIHLLKHSLLSFFMLTITFLLAISTGNEMYELHFNGLYVTVSTSNFTTAINLQLLPRI